MSETRRPYSPFKWILPAIILAIIAIASLYIVKSNYDPKPLIKEQNPNRKEDSNRVDAENKSVIKSGPTNANDSIALPAHDTIK